MVRYLRRKSVYDVVVIGGGAAGVGVSVALKHAGIKNFVVLERGQVGASFAAWPAETRFITPSFPTNSFGMLDLNSVAVGVSPAYSLEVEHPTGQEFAAHLRQVVEVFDLPIQENTDVMRIMKTSKGFRIDTTREALQAKHVIWAAGEFQYPRLNGFEGSHFCRHTATLANYQDLEGDDFIIIGGYESGIDAAYHLACRGKRSKVFDRDRPWKAGTSDPSVALSTYSLERMRDARFVERVDLFSHTEIQSVRRGEGGFAVTTEDGCTYETSVSPLLAGGFAGGHTMVADLFESRDDGYPHLNHQDESTLVPGLFLCGPAVRHENHVFCFIYKYRQRFAVVAKAVATSLGLPAHELETYRQWGMYLDDLSCCGEECIC